MAVFKYYLYDSRYINSPNMATLYTVSDTIEEAREDKEIFTDAVIVKIEVNGNTIKLGEIVE